MKYATAAVIFSLAASVAAQGSCLSVALGVPSCATSCLASAASKVGCGLTDFACQCSTSQAAAIQSEAQDCVLKGCGAQTALAAVSSAKAVCECAAGGSGASAPAKSTPTPSGGSTTPSGSSYPVSSGPAETGAASPTGTKPSGTKSSPISTGGAALVAGSAAGVMGGLLAVIAAL